jgi:hypothetical protein
MATNKRIFYATQGVKLTPVDSTGGEGTAFIPGGIQSVGINTNYNIERVFQLGQLELYDTIENNPEVQVTLNKVFDGTKPLFLMTMGGHDGANPPVAPNSGSIVQFQNNRVNLDLYVHQDTNQGTTGDALSVVSCTGLYASSFTYTFPTDGNITEECTLIGNTKTWATNPADSDVFSSAVNAKGLARRWKFAYDSCIFPTGSGAIPYDPANPTPFSNITINFDLGREAVYTLGQYVPYLRYVNFPLEITTEITSIAQDGDFLNIDEDTYSCESATAATVDKPIRLVVCGTGSEDKLTIDLGDKNKLQSVNYTGGDTGGGNVQISYSFTTNNTFVMDAQGSFQTDASPVSEE